MVTVGLELFWDGLGSDRMMGWGSEELWFVTVVGGVAREIFEKGKIVSSNTT